MTIDIRISARTDTAAAEDVISAPLIVEPFGRKYVKKYGTVINLQDQREFTAKIGAAFPPERVPGADSIRVSVVGDILSGTVNTNSLESLLVPPGVLVALVNRILTSLCLI